ncbi:MAG: DUF6051 family protein [Desulfobacteraceae bacterium]|jgi:hypothetical protein
MNYINSYYELKDAFMFVGNSKHYNDLEIIKSEFNSSCFSILPGNENYVCKKHNVSFRVNNSFFNDVGSAEDAVHIKDVNVEENRNFKYYMLKPKNIIKVKKAIFLLHGFNEKHWDKYLPWGKYLCQKTQSAIIFFPIAFHMQRAPLLWSEKRKMFRLSEDRKKKYPYIVNSTLSNVAISMRLHTMPQRFIWSGLQTYYDVIQFIEECKSAKNDYIDKDFSFDFFAYSIGGLLAEILKLSNYKNYFDETKVGMFCSGAVFNRLSPVSKYILDSEANVALYSYLVEHFDSFLNKDAHLNHYIEGKHFEGKVFYSMLDYQKMRDFRECLFKKMEKYFYAISLKEDRVIPSFEIMNTLQGAFRNINIRVDEENFNYKYTHENPFPINSGRSLQIEENFNRVFNKFSIFFNS